MFCFSAGWRMGATLGRERHRATTLGLLWNYPLVAPWFVAFARSTLPLNDARDGIALRCKCHMSLVSSRFFVWHLAMQTHTLPPSHAD